MSLKLLHTGDVHLGAPFKHLGARATEQRLLLQKTFTRVVDVALEERVDVFLIAGDLFDANRVSDAEIAFARNELKRLGAEQIPVVMIGGTHDCLAENAVLQREGVVNDMSHITLLTPDTPQKTFAELGLTVSGTSNITNKSRTSPLAEFPTADTAFHVGMIHGSLAIPGKHAETDMPFTSEEVAASGLNYLAVGHWHSLNDISVGETVAFYAGAPEPIDFGEHRAGFVLLVELEEGKKAEATPVRVGVKTFMRKELDVTGYQTTLQIHEQVVCHADKNCAIEVVLTGVRKPTVAIDQKQMEEALGEQFFNVLVKDTTTIALEDIDAASYPEDLVIGQFLRHMKQRVEQAETDEQRKVAEMALQIGAAHLEGRTD